MCLCGQYNHMKTCPGWLREPAEGAGHCCTAARLPPGSAARYYTESPGATPEPFPWKPRDFSRVGTGHLYFIKFQCAGRFENYTADQWFSSFSLHKNHMALVKNDQFLNSQMEVKPK